MADFYRRALKKLDKLDTEQRRELLISAVAEINLFKNVLDSIDKGIIVCDVEYNLIMANKCAQRLIPMNCTEGVKLNTAIKDELLVEAFRDIILNRERVIDKEIDVEYQERSRLLSVNVVPLVHDRRITGTLIYIEDITEKRRVESRLRRAENLASLTTLAAGVAHEIKNPLGSISIHLQLLRKTLAKKYKSASLRTGDKTMEKYFDILKEEVNRLNRIVVDFLFAVRPMALELREGDINLLVAKIVEFVRFEMEQSRILCLLELDENLPKILMDERYMKQAILNLVTNARAAMPNGGVFTIATNLLDNEIQILVCDTGIGISRENIAKIFDPYFTTKETGTGLGLTQVYKIIREHHGEISVDSAPGEGAEFEIILPVPRKETRLISFNEGDQK